MSHSFWQKWGHCHIGVFWLPNHWVSIHRVSLRGEPFDFWGDMGDFEGKIVTRWSRRKKMIVYCLEKKIVITDSIEKNCHNAPEMSKIWKPILMYSLAARRHRRHKFYKHFLFAFFQHLWWYKHALHGSTLHLSAHNVFLLFSHPKKSYFVISVAISQWAYLKGGSFDCEMLKQTGVNELVLRPIYYSLNINMLDICTSFKEMVSFEFCRQN